MTRLANFFSGISVKVLSAVEASRDSSNQHEFNGTAAMKAYLGVERRAFQAQFMYLGTDEDDRLALVEEVTWYDAREKHPLRSEHRMYFSDNEVMTRAAEGDVLITALKDSGELLIIVSPIDSHWLPQLCWLFDIPELPAQGAFSTILPAESSEQKSTALLHYLAEKIGLELEDDAQEDWTDLLLQRFGLQFPKSRDLSGLALETLVGTISAREQPDDALVQLMDREEALFRQLERELVRQHLQEHAVGWADDVDAFVKFSLSVQNRRKSRAGHALENHLEWIFKERGVRFQRGAKTENRARPDFLFPGQQQYHDPGYSSSRLCMLGVKTSCKDRWRQVISEAHRIDVKHLFTLEPGISEYQTSEMTASNLILVLPKQLHTSFSQAQRTGILSLEGFMEFVEHLQE